MVIIAIALVVLLVTVIIIISLVFYITHSAKGEENDSQLSQAINNNIVAVPSSSHTIHKVPTDGGQSIEMPLTFQVSAMDELKVRSSPSLHLYNQAADEDSSHNLQSGIDAPEDHCTTVGVAFGTGGVGRACGSDENKMGGGFSDVIRRSDSSETGTVKLDHSPSLSTPKMHLDMF